MTYIVCKRTMKLEKVDPDGEGKKICVSTTLHYRAICEEILSLTRIALIDDLQSWKVLSVLEPV